MAEEYRVPTISNPASLRHCQFKSPKVQRDCPARQLEREFPVKEYLPTKANSQHIVFLLNFFLDLMSIVYCVMLVQLWMFVQQLAHQGFFYWY